ncbi:mRNA decay activator protein ZFP36L1 [Mastacembelus armatus]|uniref:mRNA decay activator protein ZFP36 n=1 Tax=Mastacembelus armatus TaxID=205130 RepID=A0A3Q3SSL7_9TELE|nr:mRNA decay activator protein ZFP36L1-like [Mastacembelus armatus]
MKAPQRLCFVHLSSSSSGPETFRTPQPSSTVGSYIQLLHSLRMVEPTMASDFLAPFLELDEFGKNFHGLEATDGSSTSSQQLWQNRSHRVLGFQRRHSLCPVTLPNSKFNSSSSSCEGTESSACWGLSMASNQQWSREGQLLHSSLSHIPFRVDRSVSMIEGNVCSLEGREEKISNVSPPGLLPPPGFCISTTSLSSTASSSASRPPASSPHISTRYKTELCRTYEESGSCKYGAKCQFAHGLDELRGLSRHPKYKTEPCRTFHTIGFCPYGARCHFIHNADELHPGPAAIPPQKHKMRPPLLRHSLSFAGFSSSPQTSQPVEQSQLSSLLFTRASSVSPPPSSTGSPELLSPLFPEQGVLKHYPYPFSGITDLANDSSDSALCFYAVNDSVSDRCPTSAFPSKSSSLPYHLPEKLPVSLSSLPGLQRCSSADSLCEEGYTSSCSLSSSSSRTESPSFEGRRLPIFSRLSVSDE